MELSQAGLLQAKRPNTNGTYLGGSIIDVGWVRQAVCAVTQLCCFATLGGLRKKR
jgi:hypothetical protein